MAAQIEAGYDQFGGIISAYLGRANRCPGAKGDAASVSIQVPFGPGLGQVAKLHDVAFGEKFGAGEAVPDFVEEGYATLAPELRRPGRRYVHFVLIGWNWDASRTPGSVVDSDDEPDRALSRAWTVTSETSETDEGMAAFLRQLASSSPYPTIGFAVTLDVKRSSKLDPASTARRALMDRWSSDLVKLYSTAGFTILSDDDLRRLTGMGMTDYRERMLRSTPYSQRESVKETFGPGSFLARSEASCQAPDGTQRIALVLSTYGHASDPEDYGSLVLVSVVVSTCASDAQRVGASQRRAARDAAAIIRREIEGTR